MARIKLPHEAFGTFIRAANTWLARKEIKNPFEVRLANQNGNLHLSSGADSNYIEAELKVDPADIAALTQPIFLDAQTLSAYKFDTDGLTMVVPQTEKDDQRITFSVPGFNFRVPRKNGDIWKRNYFDLKEHRADGLILDREGFAKLWKNMDLPNSFKTNRDKFQVSLEVTPQVGYTVHAYDGMGALCNTFKDDKTLGLAGQMVFLEEFFVPCNQFKMDTQIGFSVSETQSFGEFKSEASNILSIRWTQPRYQRPPVNIPSSIQKIRMTPVFNLKVSPKDLSANIERACMLLSNDEMRSIPLEFEAILNQYSLVTRKPSGEGEVRAEGELLEPAPKNIKLHVQALCWKDYLKQLEPRVAVNMEVYKETLLLSQVMEDRELLYWMPLLPSVGKS